VNILVPGCNSTWGRVNGRGRGTWASSFRAEHGPKSHDWVFANGHSVGRTFLSAESRQECRGYWAFTLYRDLSVAEIPIPTGQCFGISIPLRSIQIPKQRTLGRADIPVRRVPTGMSGLLVIHEEPCSDWPGKRDIIEPCDGVYFECFLAN
jgi:hypothetical protein